MKHKYYIAKIVKNYDMVDVKNKMCITCKLKQPNFNYPNKNKHYIIKAVNKCDMIDVKHKKCITCELKIPYFNYTNEKHALYCNNCIRKHGKYY